MKIIIDFKTDNQAFKENFEYQVENIMDKVKVAIISDNLSKKNIRDWNGNTIGDFKIIYGGNKWI